jgi:hypothetical protein
MRRKKPSKRIVLILAGVLVLIAVGLYTWQSALAWSDYERRLAGERAAYERLQVQTKSGTAQERLEAIRELDDKLADRATLCDMSALYAWQANIVPMLREGVETCEAALKRLNALSGPLGALRDYLDTAEKLREAVADMAPAEKLTETNWAELGLKKAEQTRDSLKDITTQDEDAKRLLTQAKGLSDRLVKAWGTLISANQAKDKAAFIGASAAVVKAYADFAGLADTADSDITEKANEALKVVAAGDRS